MTMLIPAVLATLGTASVAAAQDLPHVQLVNDTKNNEFIVVVGPVDLPAGMMHSHGAEGAVFPPVETVTIPESVYLTGFSYEVVDGSGNPVPRETLHHFNLINPDNRELFLPISQRMLAVGSETGAQSMPWFLLGYPVPDGTRMVVASMMHNPTGKSYTGAEVRVHLKYVKAGRPWPLLSVYPFQMDVAFPAGDKSVDLPPGKSEFSYEASPAMEGRIMVIGSHLHPLAENIRFYDVTADKLVWEGWPVEDENGDLTGVTIGHLYRKLGVKIFPDHKYRVTVSYNNPGADTLYAGGMGVVAGVFMPAAAGIWPRANKDDELYALDRKHYLREVRGSYELIAAGGGALAGDDEKAEHGGDQHRHEH
ncbi:MAG: hypothetical protein ACE5HT_00255 [Gemmatimonadales bacterium]